MPKTKSGGSQISKDAAISGVSKIINDEDCQFHLVPFMNYKKTFQGSSLRSSAYEKYLVLCHGKSYYHAGWFVCLFVKSGICSVTKGLLPLKLVKEELHGIRDT